MRVLIQRVKEARVTVEKEVCGSIGKGLLIFLGIHREDKAESTLWLVNKLLGLRLFADSEGKMNLSLKEIEGEALVVSQFTLYGNCLNGRRPDFIQAAPPETAQPIYEKFIEELRREIGRVQTGMFGAYMEVALINDGPVTFLIERN